MTLFADVPLAPRDPILGLTEQFAADGRSAKVNLGVGVYFDGDGKLPLLACVRVAEQQRVATGAPRGYLPIDGIAAYDRAVQELVFGAGSPLLAEGRVATVQALGGTGGLKVGADFLARHGARRTVLISDPSWENHRALFAQAGFEAQAYAYYDASTHGLRFDAMMADLAAAAPGTVVVLHACCHNPTGVDLDDAQWDAVIACCRDGGLVPFLDMAYQGFGDGLAEDGRIVGRFIEAGLEVFVATSFSKNFSLYGERVGALSVVCGSREVAQRVLSQLKATIRANYSTPPTHGAQLVTAVLTTPALRAGWEVELAAMRDRIKAMRRALVDGLAAAGARRDFSFVARQRGMFSYSGLDAAQMQRLRAEHAVYGLDSGRICVAALNAANLPRVVDAIVAVSDR